MEWKDFRPTPRRLLLTPIIFVLLPVISRLMRCVCMIGEHCPCPYTEHISFLAAMLLGFKDVQLSVIPILGLVLAYFLSCTLVYLWNRISSETKLRFKENLKPSKSKIIISLFGWITAVIFLFPVQPGALLYSLLDVYFFVLIPFLFPIVLFFNATLILIALFGAFIKIPINLTGGYGIHPANLTGLGTAIIVPIMIIEWYLFSCLIIHIYKRYRKTRTS